MLLKNSPTKDWGATRRWSPSYISSQLATLNNVQAHRNRTFSYFKDAKPLADLPEVKARYKTETFAMQKNVSSLDFFRTVLDRSPEDPFYYAVVGYEALTDDLKADMEPMSPLVSVPPSARSKSNKEDQSTGRLTTVWLGPSGATTQAHYDVHDNFYAQVVGRKRFLLFPPNQYRQMYINGFMSQAAQQSQVDLENPDFERFPLFASATALDVVLEPGDVLYVPALWFHHVIAVEMSFSVSIWSRNEEVIGQWDAEKTSPAFSPSWPYQKLLLASSKFLRSLFYATFADILSPEKGFKDGILEFNTKMQELGKEDPEKGNPTTRDENIAAKKRREAKILKKMSKNKAVQELLAAPSFDYLQSYESFLTDLLNIRYKEYLQDIPSLARKGQNDPFFFCDLESAKEGSEMALTSEEALQLDQSAQRIASFMQKTVSPHKRAIWLGNYFELVSKNIVQHRSQIVAYLQSLVDC